MPRQFALRGDRLAFSYGIIVLATLAAALDESVCRSVDEFAGSCELA